MATRKRVESGPASDKAASSRNRPDGTSQSELQIAALEQGIRLFQEQRFAEAREFLDTAAKGSQRPVALTAKNYLTVCDRRTQKLALELQTADDHYNYAVERLNARDLPTARKHLEVALALRSDADHILYAFASVLALSGDPNGAYENLRRAIEAEPRNRNTARQDPDFAGVANHPLFIQLLHPERAHQI